MNEMWYALVQDEQLGPMSFNEVIDFYYKDIITSETLLWREGLAEWAPISQLREFKDLLFQGDFLPHLSQAAVNGDTRIFQPEAPPSSTPGLDDPLEPIEEPIEELLEGAFEESEPMEAAPATPPPFQPPLMEPSSPGSEPPFFSPQPLPPELTPHPSEARALQDEGLNNTLGFNERETKERPLETRPLAGEAEEKLELTSSPLQLKQKKSPPWGVISVVGALSLAFGGYLLGELTSPPSSASTSSKSLPLPLPTPKEEPIEALKGAQEGSPSDPALNTTINAATSQTPPTSVGGVTPHDSPSTSDEGLAGTNPEATQGDVERPAGEGSEPSAGIEALPLPNEGEAPPDEVVIGDIELELNAGAAVEGEAGTASSAPSQNNAKTTEKPSTEKPSTEKPSTEKPSTEKAGSKSKKTPSRSRVRSKPKPRVAKRSPKKLPTSLSRQDINKVIKRAGPRLKACASPDPELKGKTVTVMMQVSGSGKVTRLTPSNRHLNQSPQKACVLDVLQKLSFPPYDGEMPAFPLPLKL